MVDEASVPIVVLLRDASRGNRLTPVILQNGRPVWALQEFFRERNCSLKTEQAYARSIALLILFLVSHATFYQDKHRRREIYNGFANALRFGTITNGVDPTSLWWRPRTMQNVRPLLNNACIFSDWLLARYSLEPINPKRSLTPTQTILLWRRRSQFRYTQLLGHISSTTTSATRMLVRSVALPDRPLDFVDAPPAFPPDAFLRLLNDGFRRRTRSSLFQDRFSVRDILIALLLEGGGLRVSEPFHIFVGDVTVDPLDPRMPLVRVYHPSDGDATYLHPISGNVERTNRAAFLQTQYGLMPLNLQSPNNGWKGNALQRGGFMPVYWFPRDYGRLFLALYRLYITEIRSFHLNHPWLFVNLDGEPLTSKAYRKLHAAAIRRLGLGPDKNAGTTPHGHRHAYGQRIQTAVEQGILDTKIFALMMHHRSLLSQDAYNQPDADKINIALARATDLSNKIELPTELARIYA